jgi:hypothetical protein
LTNGPRWWVRHGLYRVERGERASVLDIHVVSAVLYRSLCALLNANYLFLCDRTHRLLDTWFPRELTGRPSSCVDTRQARILDLSFRGPTVPVAMVVDPATFKTPIVGTTLVILFLSRCSRCLRPLLSFLKSRGRV